MRHYSQKNAGVWRGDQSVPSWGWPQCPIMCGAIVFCTGTPQAIRRDYVFTLLSTSCQMIKKNNTFNTRMQIQQIELKKWTNSIIASLPPYLPEETIPHGWRASRRLVSRAEWHATSASACLAIASRSCPRGRRTCASWCRPTTMWRIWDSCWAGRARTRISSKRRQYGLWSVHRHKIFNMHVVANYQKRKNHCIYSARYTLVPQFASFTSRPKDQHQRSYISLNRRYTKYVIKSALELGRGEPAIRDKSHGMITSRLMMMLRQLSTSSENMCTCFDGRRFFTHADITHFLIECTQNM